MDFHTCLMSSLVEWGIRAGPESLKIQTLPCIFDDFSGGVESMVGPRIIENTLISVIVSISSVKWRAWEAPESLGMSAFL